MSSIKFEFPDTGEGVTEGKFLEWKIDVGDKVEEDQVVGEAETDKAVVEIPAPADGTVKELMASPGDRVEVGDAIMELDTRGSNESSSEESNNSPEEQSEAKETEEKDTENEESEEPEEDEKASDNESSEGDILALPKVRKLAEEKGVELASIKTGERITEEEVLQAASGEGSQETEVSGETVSEAGTEEVNASPSVRQLAREKEVDIQSVEGSGRGGKVTRQDVLDATETEETSEEEASTREEPPTGQSSGEDYSGEVERVEMSGIRKSIASKMEKSRFTAPHVTHVEKADITELAELRDKVKNEVDAHLTYLPFVMKACTKALQDYPSLNSELDEENDTVVQKKYYDFNIAVDTDDGLLVPRIDSVKENNMVELAQDIVEKAEAARAGELSQEEMKPGTFSITNLGVIGGEEFTPIINYPQVAILGIGKIGETAEVVDGEVKPRTTVKLSLSYDHRVVDGATAAKFMNDVVENLEKPEELMVNL
ncbi:biotin/lipoyl-binding protein [Candidatus Nanohaloarchaea archaeon]|nr:biotin/lipoyl-binding protein [Candidatus Nanohaloarchaea archaeon]